MDNTPRIDGLIGHVNDNRRMTTQTTPDTIHLRASGVGVITGGVVLTLGNVIFPPFGAAVVVVLVGIGWIRVGLSTPDPRTVGLGIILVGGIGVIEASPLGLGVDPLILGLFAIAFGLIDLIVGLLIVRYRHWT